MSASLRIPPQLGSAEAPAWFGAWGKVCGDVDLELLLPAEAFLRPAGIVLLAAGIADRREHGQATRLRAELPRSDVYRYLQRVDFFSELGVDREETFERHDSEGRFVPLKRITDLATARELAEAASQVLESKLPTVGPSPLRMARFVFEELGANVVQHSRAARTGFGMAQAYPKQRRIELAFADAGVGFLQSLRRNEEFASRLDDEGEALQLALGRGLSSQTPGRGHMGMGLALLVQFADLLDGDLFIASGDALLHRRTWSKGERTTVVRRTAGWKGSWICLEAALP